MYKLFDKITGEITMENVDIVALANYVNAQLQREELFLCGTKEEVITTLTNWNFKVYKRFKRCN